MFPKLSGITVILAFLLAGCGISVREQEAPSPTAYIVTATLAPTLTPPPTETPLPPPPTPTIAPVEGTASTQINVRAEPSTAGNVLGVIPANAKVEIVGKDPGGNWWQIIYPAGADGKGWVTAQYVTTAGNPEVPVIGGDEENPGSGGSAVVIQQLNIRSGPGTNFNSLGVLNANDVVNLIGKNSSGSWLQIEFAGGPDGRGWVNAGFVWADGVDALPIVSNSGEVIGTGTPVDTPLPPTPTIVPAPIDNDSAEHPVKTVIFDRAGINTLIYNGDVSAPTGDTEDWIAFTPYTDIVFAGIECSVMNSIVVKIIGSETSITCNEAMKAIPVRSGTASLFHIQAVSSPDSLRYTNYTLTIKTKP